MRTIVALSLLVSSSIACGGDDASDGTGTTTGVGTTGSSGESGPDSTGPVDASTSSSSGGADTSGDATSSGTTGEAEDPSYPAPDDGGMCPDNTAPITLPGGAVCSPFCAGADAPCPAPASGDAMGVCTPFEQAGGSGTPCTVHGDCPDTEACGPAGTCIAVAFWGCRLQCDDMTTCSDAMICAGDACAYP